MSSGDSGEGFPLIFLHVNHVASDGDPFLVIAFGMVALSKGTRWKDHRTGNLCPLLLSAKKFNEGEGKGEGRS